MAPPEWRKIRVSATELCLDTTLRCGQSFRWRKEQRGGEDGEDTQDNDDEGVWTCALRGRLLRLRQDDEFLYYNVAWPEKKSASSNDDKRGAGSRKRKSNVKLEPTQQPLTPPSSIQENGATEDATTTTNSSSSSPTDLNDDTEAFLRHYLNLSPDLSALYAQWSSSDKNFAAKAPRFTGVRILRQDAWEALAGFICSSNNNIARISQMMEKLCTEYGPRIGTSADGTVLYHDLPSPSALASSPSVEQRLRELGFGYRAKYLYKTAVMLVEKEAERKQAGIQSRLSWLDSLRNPELPAFGSGVSAAPAGSMLPNGRDGYRDAHLELLALQGVGPKVADCVCLMGLGWGEAVPVDTHVWQIAVRDYKFGKGGKNASMTRATYDAVGDHFRKLWGKEAGWAHSVLFTADLRQFADRLRHKVEVKEEEVVVHVKAEQDGGEETEASATDPVVKVEETTVSTEVVKPASGKRRAVKMEAEGGGGGGGGGDGQATVIEEKTTVRTTRAKRRRQG